MHRWRMCCRQFMAQEGSMLRILSSFFLVSSLTLAIPQVTAEEIPAGGMPDLAGVSSKRDFHCELGNHVTIIRVAGQRNQIQLRWRGRTHRMVRVNTSTGANRFENKASGLVWIDIPTKGILLNSHSGKQLANECKDYIKLRRST